MERLMKGRIVVWQGVERPIDWCEDIGAGLSKAGDSQKSGERLRGL